MLVHEKKGGGLVQGVRGPLPLGPLHAVLRRLEVRTTAAEGGGVVRTHSSDTKSWAVAPCSLGLGLGRGLCRPSKGELLVYLEFSSSGDGRNDPVVGLGPRVWAFEGKDGTEILVEQIFH